MTFKWVDINYAMAMTTKRPSDRKIRKQFPQYKNIDECPFEHQATYLDDLVTRYTHSPKPDIRDFIEFMEWIGELPPH